MDITPLISDLIPYVQGFGKGHFVIQNQRIEGPVFLQGEILKLLSVDNVDLLQPSHFQAFESAPAAFILIGSGELYKPLPSKLQQFLIEKKIAVEVMDTAAACRTYAVLIAEGRNIAAFLFPLF